MEAVIELFADEAVIFEPEFITIFEFAVGPLLKRFTVFARIVPSIVMFPLSEFVFPAPSLSSKTTFPVPALIIFPEAREISALPASLSASTTPLAERSLA